MHHLKNRGFQHPVASDITPRELWQSRRQWLQAAAAAGIGLTGLSSRTAQAQSLAGPGKLPKLVAGRSGVAGAVVMDKPTSYDDLTHYNNFYEFGTDKSDPGRLADSLQTRPWTVTIEGAVQKPRTFGIEDLLKLAPLEERIYRLRCVEGWSMVIPWIGYSLSQLLRQVEPTGNAKYVEFVSLANPAQMPGLRSGVLDWPYVEGLRLDEARHQRDRAAHRAATPFTARRKVMAPTLHLNASASDPASIAPKVCAPRSSAASSADLAIL